MEGLAEYYSAELSQKIRRGLHESRQKGYFSGGKVPYGYRVENKRVYVHEDQARVVRFIFQEYAGGKIAKDIIAELTAKGILYHNKPFVLNTMYKMLRLEKYIGICRYDDGVYDNIYPAIIGKELFDAVGRILEKNKVGSKSRRADFLLKGKLICGYCGKNLQGDSGTSKSGKAMHYYKCMSRKRLSACNKKILSKEKFEQFVLDKTLSLFTPDTVSVIANEVMRVHEKRLSDNSLLNILTAERDSIQKSLANVMKAIEQGIINATTKSRMDELERQLAETEDKILVEQYKVQSQLNREQVVEYLTHALRQNAILLLQTLIRKIVVFDDKIEIYYNYTDKAAPDLSSDDDRDSLCLPCSDTAHFCPPVKV